MHTTAYLNPQNNTTERIRKKGRKKYIQMNGCIICVALGLQLYIYCHTAARRRESERAERLNAFQIHIPPSILLGIFKIRNSVTNQSTVKM